MTTTDITAAAKTAAAARSFGYRSNQGTENAFTFCVRVVEQRPNDYRGVPDGRVNVALSVECNAQISEEHALSELLAVVAAVRSTFPDAIRSKRISRQGFWHMGRFCTTGFGVTMNEAKVAA